MKYYKKIILYAIILIFTMNFLVINTIAEPVINVTVIPDEPEPLSTVSFTANITSEETVDEVYVKIHECTPTICFFIKNLSMEFDGDEYSVDFTLEHSDATYFNYSLEIKSGDSWYRTEETSVTLKIEASNENDNNGNTGETEEDNNGGIPGFEILIFMIAVFITLIFFRRKRL